jgi:hypothetical protein
MNAFFNIDSPVDYSFEVSLHDALEAGWNCAMVSKFELEKQRTGLTEKYSFFSGDIITIMNSLRSEPMAIIGDGAKIWDLKPSGRVVHASSSNSVPVDTIVLSLVNLKMRALVAKHLMDSNKEILAIQTMVAHSELWDKIFMMHARLIRERLAMPDANYLNLLINFCISLYDYDVTKI